MSNQIEQGFQPEAGALHLQLGEGMDGVEAIFRELNRRRAQLTETIRNAPEPAERNEAIALLARLNAALDEQLRGAVESLIARRVETASRDALTGLPNRAAFAARLREEVTRARRYGRPVSLALLDVDALKAVNDRHGHLAGDDVLAGVSRILRSSLRSSDGVFRYGGDEFAAICPETPGDAIRGVLERVEARIQSWAGEQAFAETIGVSWGVASSPPARDERELIRFADDQLYLCKSEHHNQRRGRQ
jgi:diguanylate cyclase (GGDEF)-like protein